MEMTREENMIRVAIGDVIAENEGFENVTYYWCHEAQIKRSHDEQVVVLERVVTINGSSIEHQPNLILNTEQPVYIEPKEADCHDELKPQQYCADCGAYNPEEE